MSDSVQPTGLNHVTATDGDCRRAINLIAKSFFKNNYRDVYLSLEHAPHGAEGYELRVFSKEHPIEAEKFLSLVFHRMPATGNGREAFIKGDSIKHAELWQIAKAINALACSPLVIHEDIAHRQEASILDQISAIQSPRPQVDASISQNTVVTRGLPKDASIEQLSDAMACIWRSYVGADSGAHLALHPSAVEGDQTISLQITAPNDGQQSLPDARRQAMTLGRFIGMLEGHIPAKQLDVSLDPHEGNYVLRIEERSTFAQALNGAAAAMGPTVITELDRIGGGKAL